MADEKQLSAPRHHQIDVDWISPTPLSPSERDAIAEWYGRDHGEGNLDLARFVAFWLQHDDIVFKRFRRWVDAIAFGPLPALPGALIYLHHYTLQGWDDGALYEVIGAFHRGATKPQILDTLAIAFIHAGPMGISRIARGCSSYLDGWDTAAEKPSYWPPGWQPNPAAFNSGLDFSQRGLSPSEQRSLFDWYEQNQGEVPTHVRQLARFNPEAIKSMRQRYEGSLSNLPAQIVPLFMVLTNAISGVQGSLRRHAFQARHLGVTRPQLLATIERAMAYTGEATTDLAFQALEPLLDDWPD